MSFIVYDLIFLAVFSIFVAVFLYKRRSKLKREMGIMFLYKTQIGVKFIDRFSKKYEKILKPMQYVVIASGMILMLAVIWIFAEQAYIYVTQFNFLTSQIGNKFPILVFLPYAPEIFGFSGLLPPLYFTYFIIVYLLIAVPHEFSHGIFARLNKIKIHSTGFAFLGPILGAFVEQDDKQMSKAKKFPQMSILAAGTFANVITGIIFLVLFILLLGSAFHPAGIRFNSYPNSVVNISEIDSQTGITLGEIEAIEIVIDDEKFFTTAENLELAMENGIENILAFDDAPAVKAGLRGAIMEFNGEKITSIEDLSGAIGKAEPGQTVKIKTAQQENLVDTNPEIVDYEIVLDERDGKAYLGVGWSETSGLKSGGIGYLAKIGYKIKDPFVYYESSWGEFGWFVYYLLWWIVLASFAVALFNMLPLAILDGGRFFYLAVWGLTVSEKFGRRAFKFMTWVIVLLLLALIFRWALGFA